MAKKKQILVVDDEESLVELLRAILEPEGYDVITAMSGKEALEILQKEKPDLVLLDMMMPGMSGRECCDSIRKNPKTKDQKIMFVTVAKFSEMGKTSLKKMGVLEYITKPFENEDIIKKIKKALK